MLQNSSKISLTELRAQVAVGALKTEDTYSAHLSGDRSFWDVGPSLAEKIDAEISFDKDVPF